MPADDADDRGWPSDLLRQSAAPAESTPQEVLRAEADDLGVKTNGLLHGRVDVGAQGQLIVLDLFIVAPGLDDYEFRLLTIRHRLLPAYPAEVVVGPKDKRRAGTADDLLTILSDVFRSTGTRSVVSQLLDLVRERGQHTAA